MTQPAASSPVRPWAALVNVLAGFSLTLGVVIAVRGGLPPVDVGSQTISLGTHWLPLVFGLALLLLGRDWTRPLIPRLSTRPLDEAQLFPAAGSGRFWLLEFGLVTLAMTALVGAATWPQALKPYLVPDLGDPLFSVWRLSWIAHQLPIDPAHLFDGNTFHPERLTLTFSDPILLPALVSAPFLWLGVPGLTVYVLLFLGAMVFSGVTMYYLARALTGRREAAIVAAVAFAIYPFRFEHYSHLELQMSLWMPFTLLFLHRTIDKGRLRDGLLTGLGLACQALSSLYFGVFLAAVMVPIGATLWRAKRCRTTPLRALAAGAVLSALLVAPVGAAFIVNKPALGERSKDEIVVYSARPADFLNAHFRSRLFSEFSAGRHFPEREIFPGVALVVLAVVALWPPLSVGRLAYGFGLAFAVDGAMGLNGLLYPVLHQYGIVFKGLRSPARFSMVMGLALSVLAAYAVTRLANRWPARRLVIAGTAIALVALSAWPRMTFEMVPAPPLSVYDAIPTSDTPAVLAELPTEPMTDALYAYFSTFHWHRLLNGNSGFYPPTYWKFGAMMERFPDPEVLDYLRSRQVGYVVIHGGLLGPERTKAIDAAVGRIPSLTRLSSRRFRGGTTTVYRLEP